MQLEIQLFGGRGASASSESRKRGTGSGFLGEEKGGANVKGISGNIRLFAGDKVTRQSDGKEFNVSSAKGSKIELYSGDETIKTSSFIGYQFKERGTVGNRILAKQRVNVLKNAQGRTTMNGRSVAMYDKVPRGFRKLEGATTAPKGYSWYANKKSRFGDEYINILVKDKKRK